MFDLTCIKWFDGITELVPSNLDDMESIVAKAESYVIIEPVAAKALLKKLNEDLDESFLVDNLEAGAIFTWDYGVESFFRIDFEVAHLIRLHNSLATLTESAMVRPRRFQYSLT